MEVRVEPCVGDQLRSDRAVRCAFAVSGSERLRDHQGLFTREFICQYYWDSSPEARPPPRASASGNWASSPTPICDAYSVVGCVISVLLEFRSYCAMLRFPETDPLRSPMRGYCGNARLLRHHEQIELRWNLNCVNM